MTRLATLPLLFPPSRRSELCKKSEALVFASIQCKPLCLLIHSLWRPCHPPPPSRSTPPFPPPSPLLHFPPNQIPLLFKVNIRGNSEDYFWSGI
jgi:hypothetical protein